MEPDGGGEDKEFPAVTRRGLLVRGGGLITGATLGASLGLGFPPTPAQAFDWFGLAGKTMPDVSGTVRFLKGEAFANKRPLRLGSRVPPGAFVTVSREGKLIIAIADGSVFTLFGGSQLKLLVGRMRQGLLNLLAGALLLVAPKRARYLVGGPQASFGIKGTVVFHQVFGPQDKTARTMEGTIQVPDYAGSYFCTCNGAVDYLAPGQNDPYFSDRADYHNSFFIHASEKGRIVKAPMLNHGDKDIRELTSYQDGPKHDIRWLRH
ncbi:MAG: hypothetical protein V3S64_13910 [bacterium]